MTEARSQVAQINVARLVAPLTDPVMADFVANLKASYFETFPANHSVSTPAPHPRSRARSSGASGHRRDEHATRTFPMPRQPLRLAFGLVTEAVHHALRDAHFASFFRPPNGSSYFAAFLAVFLTDCFAVRLAGRFADLPTLMGAGRACCG